MSVVEIKAEHSAIDTYYENLDALKNGLKLTSEGSTRRAFGRLLEETSKARKWTLAEEVTKRMKNHRIRLDGVLYGKGSLPRGYWEAKDESDDLSIEIIKKKAKEYPVNNIIFEDTSRAILIQDTVQVLDIDLRDREALSNLLSRFYNYEMEPFEEFDKAVEWFSEIIPEIGRDLTAKIAQSHKDNKKFQKEFDEFMELCKTALNPNISKEAVDEMLIQHLLTERLIRNIFQSDFIQRNVIASKVEDVIKQLGSRLFDRSELQQSLDSFYKVIENAANSLASDYQAKQEFINTVYEQFFQGYSVKTADTHGIVYTPQEIVDFMCAAVEEVLQDEFGKKLGQEGVAILDPATGTGNFIINLLNRVNPRYRRDFYKKNLFANEVMLMPYYIASLNIEHEYYALEGEYEPFEGLAFVDTLDLAKKKQMSFDFMTEKNSERVKRQQESDITVIIGNPPYNANQVDENDNNKNRTYDVIDQRIRETYVKDSSATLNNKLYDPYVRFFRWASDRLNKSDGMVCFVTNNGFVDNHAFDGMRNHILKDFNRVYILDLKGNVRRDSMRDGIPIGEANTVFGLAAMVGISIAILVRNKEYADRRLYYYAVDWKSTRQKKFELLENAKTLSGITWKELIPNHKSTWLLSEYESEFEDYIPIGDKDEKSSSRLNTETIFKTFSLGVSTNRDAVVHDFNQDELANRISTFVEEYNREVDRYKRTTSKVSIDDFVNYDTIKWSSTLKRQLSSHTYAEYNFGKIQSTLYRPFSKQFLYYDSILVDRTGHQAQYFPKNVDHKNMVIWVKTGSAWDMFPLISNTVVNLLPQGGSQCFPFYTYDEDGSNRRENITDWALNQFREYYADETISKWDIFYYVYGLLHHPGYRERYADNLKRELPRIPYVPKNLNADAKNRVPTDDINTENVGTAFLPSGTNQNNGFWIFSSAGKKLADIHLNYEDYKRYDVEWIESESMQADYRVEKMRPQGKRKMPLSEILGTAGHTQKTDAKNRVPTDENNKENDPEISVYNSLKYNEFLTITGIPEKAFAYRLGNRSALDWIVDQYQVKTDKRSGIVSDPNGYSDDPQYILKLIERVIQVSVDTVDIVEGLATLEFREES